MSRDAILLLTDSLGVGGTERQLVELLKGMHGSDRFRHSLAVLDHGGPLEAAATHVSHSVLPVRRRGRFGATVVAGLIWHARRTQVRLIHAVGWMSGLAGLLAARALGVPIINGSLRDTPQALQRRHQVSRWCARRSNRIVANSHAALAAYGLTGHPKALVIPNAIDLGRFASVTHGGQQDPAICMVASFNRQKDHASLLRALPAIRAACPDACVVLVGDDAGTLAGNRQLATDLGIHAALRFITDSTAPEPYIAASRVCVLASAEGESCANAILEYMALAKPVVATACAGNAELMHDGVEGWFVPARTPQALAARVIQLLQQPERAGHMGEAGRRRAREFARPRLVAAYEALYDQLLRRW